MLITENDGNFLSVFRVVLQLLHNLCHLPPYKTEALLYKAGYWPEIVHYIFLAVCAGSSFYTTTTDDSHPIIFSEFHCSGSELSLNECRRGDGTSVISCSVNVVGVRCLGIATHT